MSELSRKIIDSICAGEASEAMMAFEAAAAEKMLAALDLKRQEVARDMFQDATGVDNEAALDAMRQQEVEEGVSHEDATFRKELTEAVDTYDIKDAISTHAQLHGAWERSQPGWAKRLADHEEMISQRHGQEAMKHIKAHTKIHCDYTDGEAANGKPLDSVNYLKAYGKPMQDAKGKAIKAALSHQMKNAK